MAFQTHELRGFLRKYFVRQFWYHLLILSFMTLCINRTLCVARYIYGMYILLILGACALGTVALSLHIVKKIGRLPLTSENENIGGF